MKQLFFFLLILSKLPLVAIESSANIAQFLDQEAKQFGRLCSSLDAGHFEGFIEDQVAKKKDELDKLIKSRLQNHISLDLAIRMRVIGSNPLCITSEHDQYISITKKLLKLGANPNVVSDSFWLNLIPISCAVNGSAVKTARLLLKAGANPCQSKILLHNACSAAVHEIKSMKKWKQIVKLLLKNGADPNQENDMGYTPLFKIVANGRNPFGERVLPIIKLLLAFGADVNIHDGSLISYAERHNLTVARFLKDYRDKKIKLKKKKLR